MLIHLHRGNNSWLFWMCRTHMHSKPIYTREKKSRQRRLDCSMARSCQCIRDNSTSVDGDGNGPLLHPCVTSREFWRVTSIEWCYKFRREHHNSISGVKNYYRLHNVAHIIYHLNEHHHEGSIGKTENPEWTPEFNNPLIKDSWMTYQLLPSHTYTINSFYQHLKRLHHGLWYLSPWNQRKRRLTQHSISKSIVNFPIKCLGQMVWCNAHWQEEL